MALPRVRILRKRKEPFNPNSADAVTASFSFTSPDTMEGDVIGCVPRMGRISLVVGCDDGKVEFRDTTEVEYLPEDEG